MTSILPQILINSAIAAAIYALIALGFNLIYGATKFFNMTHGVMAAIGAYMVFFLAKQMGWDIWDAAVIGVLVAGGVGWLLDRFVYRPLRKRGASGMALLVASLGAFFAMQALLAVIFTSNFQTLAPSAAPRIFTIAGGSITITQVIIIAAAIVVAVGLTLVMRYTGFGRAARAVSDDEEVARIVGINADSVISGVFCIGSAVAGLAGILVGLDTAIEPTMGMALLLKGVIAAIIGGVGSIYGGIVGSALLGVVENVGAWGLSGEWKDAIAFALLIAFLLFRPKGIIRA